MVSLRTPEPEWRGDVTLGDETYAESPSASRSYDPREVDPVVRASFATARVRARARTRPATAFAPRSPILLLFLASAICRPTGELSSHLHPLSSPADPPNPPGRRGYPEPLGGNRSRGGRPRRRGHSASSAQGAPPSRDDARYPQSHPHSRSRTRTDAVRPESAGAATPSENPTVFLSFFFFFFHDSPSRRAPSNSLFSFPALARSAFTEQTKHKSNLPTFAGVRVRADRARHLPRGGHAVLPLPAEAISRSRSGLVGEVRAREGARRRRRRTRRALAAALGGQPRGPERVRDKERDAQRALAVRPVAARDPGGRD